MKIDACFIAGIMGPSPLPRLAQDFEHRATDVELENMERMFLRDTASRTIRFVNNESGSSAQASISSGPDVSKATVSRYMGATGRRQRAGGRGRASECGGLLIGSIDCGTSRP
ncbi:hypothetical protein [Streptomyces sp. NRRL F-5702]|uniref:hypothetical protein n=1 Tax=Streptomyces sp. NRRL F-5702 TaxID=1463870 RepID=UPI00131CE014|nr:hypothetical protein [Streptomyces sp. NRRL F-5702]